MQTQQRSPILVDELQAQGYQMALYRSASMKYPAFHQTLFRHVKPLQLETEGNKAYLRDIKITQQFKQFLNQRNKDKPFFGFLFYDALHNYCQRPTPYPQPFQPAIAVCNRVYLNKDSDPKPYWNRYLNAARFEDSLVAEVVADLKQQGLLKNTVVMVTADHGEEFNDSQENYWGHVSAYTPWQLHVPMIIYWPGKPPQVIDHASSHYDVAPWFMQQFLGCTSPIGDYSVGHNLLAADNPEFIIANSYIDYAILGKDQVTRIYPQGNYQITDRNGRSLPDAKLDSDHLKLSFEALHRFYAKSK
jgi:membrane-anchored protein YejM (alkaline phosphatase superfamily)